MVIQIGVFRIEANGLAEVGDSLVEILLPAPGEAAAEVSERVGRIDLDRPREVVDRFVPVHPLEPALRPADVTLSMIRLELDDLVPVVQGAVELVAIVMDRRQERIGKHVVRVGANAAPPGRPERSSTRTN